MASQMLKDIPFLGKKLAKAKQDQRDLGASSPAGVSDEERAALKKDDDEQIAAVKKTYDDWLERFEGERKELRASAKATKLVREAKRDQDIANINELTERKVKEAENSAALCLAEHKAKCDAKAKEVEEIT